jgi:hypothetical protein
MQLAQTLSSRGMKINCVGPSKMINWFVGQKGAAAFRTDQGVFNAIFMFEPEQLAHLAVVERPQVGSLHTYEIYGTPTPRTMQGREHFFLKQDATLFVTAKGKLAKRLTDIFGEQSRLKP